MKLRTSPSAPAEPGGDNLLLIFTGAILVVVLAVVALAVVDTWWILVPVMVVDVLVTAGVTAELWHLFAAPPTPSG